MSRCLKLGFAWLALVALPQVIALADSGTVRAITEQDGLQVSVFTAPVALVAGEADVSVLVQDAGTMTVKHDARVEIVLTPQGRPYARMSVPAGAAAATNKLFQAAHVTLEPGVYDLLVRVTSGSRLAEVKCAIEVGRAPTQAAAFWPWFVWPLLPILVFAADQWRKRSERPFVSSDRLQ